MSHPALGGHKMLVLSCRGRISRLPRHTMLSYVSTDDDREYVCSGWGAKTDWYKNIEVNSLVTVQVGRKAYVAKARRVEDIDEYTKVVEEMFESGGDSHFASWLESFGIAYDREDMIAKRDRLYIVGFGPSEEAGPPPMPVDLKWLWGLMFIIMIGAWLLLR